MTTISVGHPATFAVDVDKTTKVVLSDYHIEVPPRCRMGVRVSDDTYFLATPDVKVNQGILLKNDGSVFTQPTEWYKTHAMYFVAEKDTTLTFEVVPDSFEGRK